MNIKSIIDDIQQSILLLQDQLDELKIFDDETANDILITRQEAADLLMVSLRQFDRYCNSFGIQKISTIAGVRVRKRDILIHMGVISEPIRVKQSDLQKITKRISRL